MTKQIKNAAIKKIVKALRKGGLEANHANFIATVRTLTKTTRAQLAANIAHLDNPKSFGR